MSLDYSAVPRMPDGRTAFEHIESVAATSDAIRVPMGPRSGGGDGTMMWHVWGASSGKPALLLFHGGSGSWIHWIRNVQTLAQHFTVYAADMPGLGDSAIHRTTCAMSGRSRIASNARRAARCCPKAIQKFFLTGFSFGGMVSGHLATLMPERIRRIVFVGAGGLKATRKPTEKLHKLLETMPPQVLADEARRNLELLMLHDPKNVDGVAIHMQIMNTTRARTRSRDMGIAGALSKVLPAVKVPFTGIWGEYDSTTYPLYPRAHRSFHGAAARFSRCTRSRARVIGWRTRPPGPSMPSCLKC